MANPPPDLNSILQMLGMMMLGGHHHVSCS